MSLWAIVPVKPIRRGKSRLSEILSEEERVQLNHLLFLHTIDILKQVDAVSEILVVSRDSNVLTEARELGVRTVTENGTPELNPALLRASLFSKAFSTEGVMIVPADLPLLTPSDVEAFLAKRSQAPEVIIAPDRHGKGTNMLFANPADILTFSYGDDSLSRHSELAKARGAQLTIVENERIGLDLDFPADYELLKSRNSLSIYQVDKPYL